MPLILVTPRYGNPLKLYLSTAFDVIECLLGQDSQMGHEQAMYYLSQNLIDIETRYFSIEKLYLAFNFSIRN